MKKIGLKQESELINSLNLEPVLNDRVRQVRWLYNNSNKCTKVYEEKLVRLIVFKLKQKIVQLESELTKLKLKNGKLPIPHVSKSVCKHCGGSGELAGGLVGCHHCGNY